jgi:6-pyruvoyltetrahydropterin/6-carboxytetrahydropterin synthase
MFEVSVQETFAAAHFLRGYKGKCERLHGHNYRVEITVGGERLDAIGMLLDFVEIKRELRKLLERVDHYNLNDIPPFDAEVNTTAENLAFYFWTEMQKALGDGVNVSQVKVWETDTAVATYRP